MYQISCTRNNSYIKFATMVDRAFIAGKEIILLGDVNIDPSKFNQVWDDIIFSYNFQQPRVTETSFMLIDHICPVSGKHH